MMGFRRSSPDPMAGLVARTEAAGREAEHACAAARETLAAVHALADRLERLETATQRINGRLERLELYLLALDPAYPVTQAELPPADLEAKRARLEAELNGAELCR